MMPGMRKILLTHPITYRTISYTEHPPQKRIVGWSANKNILRMCKGIQILIKADYMKVFAGKHIHFSAVRPETNHRRAVGVTRIPELLK